MTQQQQEKALTGPLERLFGGINAKILDFLSTYQDFDYSKQDIAKYSGVSFRHALKAIENLEQKGFIIHTRKSGHAHMYKYNTNNQTARLLEKFAIHQAADECTKLVEQQLKEDKEPYTITIELANKPCLMHNCHYNKAKTCTSPHALNRDICLTYRQDLAKTDPDDITHEPDETYYDNPPEIFTNAKPGDTIPINSDRNTTQHKVLKKNSDNTEITVQKIMGTTTCQRPNCEHKNKETCQGC